jgi:ribose transport system substrate-binding protein
MRGFREGYREHCRLPRQRRALADAQHYITAQTKLAAALNDVRGKPIIVAAVSDDAALGAMNAARQRGRGDHVWAAGQLAQPDVRGVIACDPHFVASVAHFPSRFGAALVPALLDALEGREVSPVLEAELQLVTAATVREVFPETPDCDA